MQLYSELESVLERISFSTFQMGKMKERNKKKTHPGSHNIVPTS